MRPARGAGSASLGVERAADFRWDQGSPGGGAVLRLTGDWTSLGIGRTGARLQKGASGPPARLDVEALGRFDTAGAAALLGAGVAPGSAGLEDRPDVRALLALAASARPPGPIRRGRDPAGVLAPVERLGRALVGLGREGFDALAFLGRLLATAGRLARRPSRLRWAPTVALMQRAGFDALPISALTSFFVGATLAFMGQSILRRYGGQAFVVEFVGVSMLREFGLLVTAIILAGRSASAFAAEIGAMRMNQEVDAMRVIGVDPFEALVAPRVLALLLTTPLLVFAAMLAGLLGGALVVWAALGMPPGVFAQRLGSGVGASHFYIGMAKAPVVALLVAAIGCRQGLAVGGDVESLGRRVTAAVVQALFAIIMADALFAFLLVEAGL